MQAGDEPLTTSVEANETDNRKSRIKGFCIDETYRNDLKIPSNKQYQLLLEIENSINFSINWMLKKEKKFDPFFILGYKHELNEILEENKSKINRINSSI